jgi:hypothetical protein
VGFVLALAAVFIVIQATFSHKLKSVEITTSNGPVSPDYQQTQTLLITKDSCSLTSAKGIDKNPVLTNCQSADTSFAEIQKSLNTYNVIDKLTASSSTNGQLIGGSTLEIKITLQNGDSFSAKDGAELQDQIQPFLDQISLSYPAVGKF